MNRINKFSKSRLFLAVILIDLGFEICITVGGYGYQMSKGKPLYAPWHYMSRDFVYEVIIEYKIGHYKRTHPDAIDMDE